MSIIRITKTKTSFLVHLDKFDRILGVELTKEMYDDLGVKREGEIKITDGNSKCSRELNGCIEEIVIECGSNIILKEEDNKKKLLMFRPDSEKSVRDCIDKLRDKEASILDKCPMTGDICSPTVCELCNYPYCHVI